MNRSKLAVIDTNIYIGALRLDLFRGQLAAINQRFILKSSAIVLLELYTGCRTRIERRAIEKMERDFGVLTPSQENFTEAGKVLNKILLSKRFEPGKILGLANDALIAMSARSIGAIVVTNNKKDFELIRECRPFDVIYL